MKIFKQILLILFLNLNSNLMMSYSQTFTNETKEPVDVEVSLGTNAQFNKVSEIIMPGAKRSFDAGSQHNDEIFQIFYNNILFYSNEFIRLYL